MTERKSGQKPHSLARYAAEAQRKPFELEVDDDTVIVLQPPTVDDVLAIEEATSSREALSVIAGEQFEPLMKALHGQPAGVIGALLDDAREWFGLGNS